MTHTFTIYEAKTQLSKLIRLVEAGDEVVISRGPTPVAKLTATKPPRPRRELGSMRGRGHVPDDFDEWPEDIARALCIID